MKSTLPRIPHLPGSRRGNDDLEVKPAELPLFLESPVVVMEKLDGIGLTIADEDGFLNVAMKSDWKNALGGRVLRAARRWVRIHEDLLGPLVSGGNQIYGEWVLHRLVMSYDRLPAAVVFHGCRGSDGKILARVESNPLFQSRGLAVMEPHFRGVIGARSLEALVPKQSGLGRVKAEGIIVERMDSSGAQWAKWVAAHYRQPKGAELSGLLNRVHERTERTLSEEVESKPV